MTTPIVPQLPLEMWAEMKPLFAEAFPKEVVVAIHGDKWRQLANISQRPAYCFELHPSDVVELYDNPPDLLLHSHPSPPASAEPSDTDTEQQIKTGWNWGIVAVTGAAEGQVYNVAYPECWGDGLPIQPLLGRSYCWGIRDCWTLCRDWYRLNGYEIANTPRARDPLSYAPGTPQHNQFLYWPEKRGMKPVARHDRRPGDFAVFQFKSANIHNHCGIYLGEGKYLHQLEDALSCEWIPHNEELIIERWNVLYFRLPKPKITK